MTAEWYSPTATSGTATSYTGHPERTVFSFASVVGLVAGLYVLSIDAKSRVGNAQPVSRVIQSRWSGREWNACVACYPVRALHSAVGIFAAPVFTTITKGDVSEQETPRQVVVRTPAEWRAVLERAFHRQRQAFRR